MNLFQFIPRSAWLTPDGIARGIYEQGGWHWALGTESVGAAAEGVVGLWEDVLVNIADSLVEGARCLAECNVRPPFVGYELQDEGGAIIAEAELAWPNARLCLLRTDQALFAEAFEAAGWRALLGEGNW